MDEIVYHIGGAALAGGIFGLIGYFKNRKQEEAFEGFSSVEFLSTVAGSAVLGGIAAYSGVAPDAMASSAIGPFVYQALRKLFKGLLG